VYEAGYFEMDPPVQATFHLTTETNSKRTHPDRQLPTFSTWRREQIQFQKRWILYSFRIPDDGQCPENQ